MAQIDGGESSPDVVPWEWIETHRASAFILAGWLTIASVILPVGISALTDWAWASGILLIALAVTGVAIGLFGLYPQANNRARRTAFLGAVFSGIAAVAALGLVVGIGVVLFAEIAMGTNSPMPVGIFLVVALSMAGGFSLGFLLFGIAAWRISTISSRVGHFLVGGGLLLLIPVVVETLGLVYSVSTPAWIVFPILGVVAIDMLVIGYLLRRGAIEEP